MTELPPDIHTLSGAYAIGAVDPEEEALFEAHLRACPACAQEVRVLREVAVRLAEGARSSLPEALKAQVMARVAAARQERSVREGPGPEDLGQEVVGRRPVAAEPATAGRSGWRRTRPVTWLAAAALVVLAVAGGAVAWNEHRAADAARRLAAVLADPSARRVTGTATGGGSVQLVVGDGTAVVLTSQLPGLTQGTVYQLWVVRPGAVTSAGLGPAGDAAAGHWTRVVQGVRTGDVVAISVEPSGGSRQPTTVPIVTLTA